MYDSFNLDNIEFPIFYYRPRGGITDKRLREFTAEISQLVKFRFAYLNAIDLPISIFVEKKRKFHFSG